MGMKNIFKILICLLYIISISVSVQAKSPEYFQKSCNEGNAESCFRLSGMYFEGIGVPKNKKKSLEFLEKACEGGYEQACINAGIMHLKGESTLRNKIKGRIFFSRLCNKIRSKLKDEVCISKYMSDITSDPDCNDDRDPTRERILACYLYAETFFESPAHYDSPVAKVHYKKACERDFQPACDKLKILEDDNKVISYFRNKCKNEGAKYCSILAKVLSKKRGATRDKGIQNEIVQSLEKACKDGMAGNCRRLAIMYLDGKGIRKNGKRAVELFRIACDKGEVSACYRLGIMFYKGQGVQRDLKSAAVFFGKACENKKDSACVNLGYMYLKGEGIQRDINQAANLFQKACNDFYKIGCFYLAEIYSTPKHNMKDKRKASKLYESSCESEDRMSAYSCTKLGMLHYAGDGVSKDWSKAIRLFVRSCRKDYALACKMAASMYEKGQGVPKISLPRARAFYKKACQLGDKYSCKKGANLKKIMSDFEEG